jgi:uncharacterized protein YqgQ
MLPSSCLSVSTSVRLSALNSSAHIELIFKKFGILVYFQKSVYEIEDSLKSTNNYGTLHADLRSFVTISRLILLRMKYFRQRLVLKIKTLILYKMAFSRKSCHLSDYMENMVQPYRPIQYVTFALRALQPTLQTHIQIM